MKAGSEPARGVRITRRVSARGFPPSSKFSAKFFLTDTHQTPNRPGRRPVKSSPPSGAWRFESSLVHETLGAYVKGQTGELQIRQSRFESGRPCQTWEVGHGHAKQSRKLSERKLLWVRLPHLPLTASEATHKWSCSGPLSRRAFFAPVRSNRTASASKG